MVGGSSGSGKKRGRSTLAPSPLVAGRKRPAKSPAPPSGQPAAMAATERDIVLDRLGKEVVPLLKEGGTTRDGARRRLRMGINEVTKFLEATAAAGALRGSTSDRIGAKGKACPPPAFAMVLICKDVRPARLVEHLQALVRLTDTPHLVLPGTSAALGKMFGFKTMAALAICPAPSPAVAMNKENLSAMKTGEDVVRKDKARDEGKIDDGLLEGGEADPLVGCGTGLLGTEGVESASAGPGPGPAQGEKGGGGGSSSRSDGRLARLDDELDSFVEFLRQKVTPPDQA